MSKELYRRERSRSAKRKRIAHRAIFVILGLAAVVGWAGSIMVR